MEASHRVQRNASRKSYILTIQECYVLFQNPGSSVIYWPSTEPSIKRRTCANKRKNSGSRWTLINNITRVQTAWISWRQDASSVRSSLQTEGFGPSVTHGWATPSQDEKEVLLWSREELSVKITACLRLQLIFHTQPTSTLSRIKCERYTFIKKCIRSFIEVRILCLIMFHIYLYMYVAIQKLHSTKQQLYTHFPCQKTTQVSRTRHAWHCRRGKDELYGRSSMDP